MVVGNPKGEDFETCRRSLIPGLLKSLANNFGKKGMPLPIKIFEIGDCVELSDSSDVGAKNVRKVAIAYTSNNSGFEIVHGALDRIMTILATPFDASGKTEGTYCLKESENPTFFPG